MKKSTYNAEVEWAHGEVVSRKHGMFECRVRFPVGPLKARNQTHNTMFSQPMKFLGGQNQQGGEQGQELARCQSCGMPLGAPGFYGTNADGSEEKEYCRFCFENGAFAQPDLTVQGMIDSSTEYMVKNLLIPEVQARKMSEEVIPTLTRWKR